MFASFLTKFTLSFLSISFIIGTLIFFPAKATAQSPDITQQLQSIAHIAEAGALAVSANDIPKMQSEYIELHEIWEGIEDDVQAQNPTAYFEIETAIRAVRDAVEIDPPVTAIAYEAFEGLEIGRHV